MRAAYNIANPFTKCKSMKKAKKLVGFGMDTPKKIGGAERKAIRADKKDKLIEVAYGKDDSKVVIRKAKGSGDISGDYTEYESKKTVTVGSYEVTMQGDKDKVSLATWKNGKYTYSVTCETAKSEEDMSSIIKAVDAEDDSSTIANPFIECKSMDEAAKAAGFDMTAPDSIEDYEEKTVQVMEGDSTNSAMIEVIYSDGKDNEICVRKAKGNDSISGDYEEYAQKKLVDVGDVKVTMKGTKNFVNVAEWTEDGYTYSIGAYGSSGLSVAYMTGLVSEIG